jgi:predicted transcriptional regulator
LEQKELTPSRLPSQIYVRQSIEAGLADCRAGRLVPVEEVKRRLGLPI